MNVGLKQARASLAEMADYCASHCPAMETGAAAGNVRNVVSSYASKWEADMLVLGASDANNWLQRIIGRSSLDLAEKLNCALFVRI